MDGGRSPLSVHPLGPSVRALILPRSQGGLSSEKPPPEGPGGTSGPQPGLSYPERAGWGPSA